MDLHTLSTLLKMTEPSNTVSAHMMPEGIETKHLDDRLCGKQGGTCVNMTCCTDNNYVTGLCVEGAVCCLGETNCDWKIAQSKSNCEMTHYCIMCMGKMVVFSYFQILERIMSY